MQLSGNTVYISEPGALLPRRNLQVLRPPVQFADSIVSDVVAETVRDHFEAIDVREGESEMALAFQWRGEPSFERLAAFARGILAALPRTIEQARPIYLVFDGDVAQTVGAILKEEWRVASDVLAIDGIALRDFDYVDLGRIRMPSFTVPVTIKSLVFRQDPRVPHEYPHDHGHTHHHSHTFQPRRPRE
jgi:ethanolamine utilization protein EutA